MRICLISNYADFPDEGQKNLALQIQKRLEQRHQVLHINIRRQMRSPAAWQELRRFHPHIIHSFLRPSASSLLAAGIVRLWCRAKKSVLSAMQPAIESPLFGIGLSLFKPELVLSYSQDTEKYFARLGWRVSLLPIGVDNNYFTPATPEEKVRLREKHGIGASAFVVLHIGHITQGRNLLILNKIQQQGNQVVLLVSPAFTPDGKVYRSLARGSCVVWRQYVENIREVYALADCYVFPTESRSHAIEIPLSVLEAMSCNLPVVTTRFAALPRLFSQGEGLVFVDRVEDIPQCVEALKNGEGMVRTREKVLPHSWGRIVDELEKLYQQLLAEDTK